MKKTLLTLAAMVATLAATTLPSTALADGLSYNVGAVSDYRYRGISQTRLKPALQGGVDYSLGGFYAGAWASTIKWVKDGGGKSNYELDLYGGYKGELAKDLAYDVGLLAYVYPSNKLSPSANTTELYAALSYGPVTAKYSHSTGNLFGFAKSSGSGYLDLSASFEVAGLTLTPHIGHQSVRRNSASSYTDYSLTVAKDFNGLLVSAALVDTDTNAYVSPNAKNLGKASVVLGAKLNF